MTDGGLYAQMVFGESFEEPAGPDGASGSAPWLVDVSDQRIHAIRTAQLDFRQVLTGRRVVASRPSRAASCATPSPPSPTRFPGILPTAGCLCFPGHESGADVDRGPRRAECMWRVDFDHNNLATLTHRDWPRTRTWPSHPRHSSECADGVAQMADAQERLATVFRQVNNGQHRQRNGSLQQQPARQALRSGAAAPQPGRRQGRPWSGRRRRRRRRRSHVAPTWTTSARGWHRCSRRRVIWRHWPHLRQRRSVPRRRHRLR